METLEPSAKNRKKFDLDLAYGKVREQLIADMLQDKKIEVKSERGKHSTQKPTELMKWVLKYYSKEGDVVLDPTMGSGSTGVACLEMKRNFIGIEMDPEIFEDAEMRLS